MLNLTDKKLRRYVRIETKEKKEQWKNEMVLVKIRKISGSLCLAFYGGLWYYKVISFGVGFL